ncbi:MAG TPA: M24B family metallopeptidase, partial [Gammaproteobacteria bacterium]|nr:M24B family metallopeptidase [Gammaproteobacteria bacterium]
LGTETLYYPLCEQTELETTLKKAIKILQTQKRKGYLIPRQHIDSSSVLDALRLIKMPDEIALLEQAATISAHAHIRGMQTCKPEMVEYELEAEYRYEFLRRGAQDVAYTPIVASGPNACILHYINNNRKMRTNELVLVDAGCEYKGYASDITRTYPVSGKFTKDQQAVYEIVLAAQEAAIQVATPSYTWEKMQEAIVAILVQGLVDLKILKGDANYLIEQGAYKPYYMHQSGHWLGLDVHDAGDYKVHDAWRQLEPGMVLTIEPGLYFPQEDQTLPEKYRGLGIRIEDDILITAKEPQVLSQEVPKTVREIEQLMRA